MNKPNYLVLDDFNTLHLVEVLSEAFSIKNSRGGTVYEPVGARARAERIAALEQEVERLKEELTLFDLISKERDEYAAVIAEMDEGDNPELWGGLVKQRDEALAEVERLLEELDEARGLCRCLNLVVPESKRRNYSAFPWLTTPEGGEVDDE